MNIKGIRDMENALEYAKARYLKKRGWKYSCTFPDSCWRWVKTFERGGQMTCSLDEAINIEEREDARR